MMIFKGRAISKFSGEGEALVSKQPISFFGGVDRNGIIRERNHDLYGMDITGRILIFPRGKGSTVGSYIIYQLKKNGHAPAGIINIETEPIIATGCIIAEIPLIDRLEVNPLEKIRTGDYVLMDGKNGLVMVRRKIE
ncbi:MAG: DUF126 domain-containing protein [Candidatus Methanomethyliaceae archaeon]|nr:DUF126 domain-containing protein [Candidatus Methanomethyliaceae archaeon]